VSLIDDDNEPTANHLWYRVRPGWHIGKLYIAANQ